VALGVKEYYFTGGEPFLNPEMTEILCETLRYGPATVLTNATVLKAEWLERLRSAEEASLYSLEFRVSIDGFSPETNDPIRGIGTFERAMEGVEKLVTHGFLPIITAARTWPMEQDREVVEQFVQLLKARGYDRPRLKILPTLHIGAEEQRTHGYGDDERVTPAMPAQPDRHRPRHTGLPDLDRVAGLRPRADAGRISAAVRHPARRLLDVLPIRGDLQQSQQR
jgi:sulfatase maturation enzyme AslB (radical SAM superfamily)